MVNYNDHRYLMFRVYLHLLNRVVVVVVVDVVVVPPGSLSAEVAMKQG